MHVLKNATVLVLDGTEEIPAAEMNQFMQDIGMVKTRKVHIVLNLHNGSAIFAQGTEVAPIEGED